QITEPECTPTHIPSKPASPETLNLFDESRTITPPALTGPAARPRIVLKLGKRKTQSEETTVEGKSDVSAKKAKFTESNDEVKNAEPHLPVEEIAEERVIDDSALASEAQQHVEATDCSTRLTSLNFSDIKSVDTAPAS
ncbi:hypothetical protein KCU73_g10863, partial [Aureobasidium melanogenum]